MFNFIRKLFKALNSSAHSWQLSGAIVLAMFAGFLPSNSLILFDILFIALILNLNFGLFLLFSVIFAGVGYLFDPLFESLGYAVLTQEGLRGFFTSLYNSALFRWSAFNYTLVSGSLIVSALLALPLFFILNKTITLYRHQIGERLNEWKLTRWMKLFNEEAQTSSVFRWWGLGVFGGLAGVIIFFLIFVFDPLAKLAIEKGLSYSLQTEVSLKGFSSSFSDLKIEIEGVEVADKERLSHNLVQIGAMDFDLGFSALMEKKAMIEQLNVSALAFNVKRAEPAEAYAKKAQSTADQSEEKTKKEEKSVNPFALPDVNDILARESLRSVEEAQSLKGDITAAQDKWAKVSAELRNSNEIEQIQKDAKALQDSLKNADLSAIASAKSDIDALKNKITALKSKYSKLQGEFNADKKSLQKQISNLKDLPAKDINRLKKKYSLNAGGGANLIGTLINKELGAYMNKALEYYALLKPYLDDAKGAEEAQELKPPRGEGRWIRYANLSKIPDLVIKDAKINLQLKNDVIDFELRDFSSNQKLYGKATSLHADAKGKGYKEFVADIIDDRRADEPLTRFDIQTRGYKSAAIDLQAMSMKDVQNDAVLKGEIKGAQILADGDIHVTQAKLQMPSEKLVNELLAAVNSFKVKIALQGDVKAPSIKVSTDLDKQLSSGLKDMGSKASKKFEKELRAGVMKKAGLSAEGISLDLGDTGSLLDSKMDVLGGINTDFSSSKSNPLKGILSF